MKQLLILIAFGLTAGCMPRSNTAFITRGQGPEGLTSLIDVSRGSFDECSGVVINSGLDLNRNLVLDVEEVKQTTFVCDGSDGSAGRDGADGRDGATGSVLEVVDPCGDDPGRVDEVVFKLTSGEFLSWMKNIGMVVLEEGRVYETSDHQKCKFSIQNGVLED